MFRNIYLFLTVLASAFTAISGQAENLHEFAVSLNILWPFPWYMFQHEALSVPQGGLDARSHDRHRLALSVSLAVSLRGTLDVSDATLIARLVFCVANHVGCSVH